MSLIDIADEDSFERAARALGTAITEARERLALTPEQLARIAHVSPLTVRRVESGELRPFTIDAICRIGLAVDIEVDFDLVPRWDELAVVAATTERPVQVLVPRPGTAPA